MPIAKMVVKEIVKKVMHGRTEKALEPLYEKIRVFALKVLDEVKAKTGAGEFHNNYTAFVDSVTIYGVGVNHWESERIYLGKTYPAPLFLIPYISYYKPDSVTYLYFSQDDKSHFATTYPELNQEMEQLGKESVDIKKKMDDLKERLDSFILQYPSVKRLVEAWPEVLEYYPELADYQKKLLPAIPPKKINNMLERYAA